MCTYISKNGLHTSVFCKNLLKSYTHFSEYTQLCNLLKITYTLLKTVWDEFPKSVACTNIAWVLIWLSLNKCYIERNWFSCMPPSIYCVPSWRGNHSRKDRLLHKDVRSPVYPPRHVCHVDNERCQAAYWSALVSPCSFSRFSLSVSEPCIHPLVYKA